MDLFLNKTPVKVERVEVDGGGHLHRFCLPAQNAELHQSLAVTCLKQFDVLHDPEPKQDFTQISVVGAPSFSYIFAALRAEGFEIKRNFA